MNRQQLEETIGQKRSYLCIGLDTDRNKIPEHLLSFADPVFEFNRRIIEATLDHCVAYKINTAFYEAEGSKGWATLERTIECIPNTHFKIADAKRGDIGNTANQYARAFFEHLGCDAVTVAPYMGEDSIRPFLEYEGKWAIVLGLTSNAGAADFETLDTERGRLYEEVIRKTAGWGNPDNLMFVVGATQAEAFKGIRVLVPNHFLLVPGVGAQGGDLKSISQAALIPNSGLLVNVSRAVIYASTGEDFAECAALAAVNYQHEMDKYLF